LQKPAQLRAWLLRTAHNLLIDHVRARKPEVPLDESLPLVGNETATWRAFEPCIVPLAQRLPEDYRSALLWDLDGVPQQEIAERQGLGLSGAKSRVQRARPARNRSLCAAVRICPIPTVRCSAVPR
jgi:RNA polymerase sigma-70 factor (ECF subfamily)